MIHRNPAADPPVNPAPVDRPPIGQFSNPSRPVEFGICSQSRIRRFPELNGIPGRYGKRTEDLYRQLRHEVPNLTPPEAGIINRSIVLKPEDPEHEDALGYILCRDEILRRPASAAPELPDRRLGSGNHTLRDRGRPHPIL
jgi:hypothetical protein